MMGRTLSGILILLVLVPLWGCSEDVVGVVGTDRPFTLWGVINPLADTQFVRVFPIEGTLQVGDPSPLDARFTSTDVTTGDETLWRDSVRVDDQNRVEHIFYAPFRAEYGHVYHLEIVAADGRKSSVDVEVPARTELVLAPADTLGPIRLPVFVGNDPANLIKSELSIGFSYIVGFSASGCPNYRFVERTLSFDDQKQRVADGWSFVINLNEVYNIILSISRNDESYFSQFGITLGFIGFSTVVASEDWVPPDGAFDPSVLVQPGTMENVENGFGFVGAGYRLSRGWSLPVSVVQRAGFRTDYEGCP